MRFPAFVQEMASESNRRKLLLGIWSGYFIASAFLALAIVAHIAELIEWSWAYYGLLVAKYVTNTLALWSLRARKGVLETQTVNTVTDVVLLTAAIYLTGGHGSPLFAIYVILIAVVAMLSNSGVTVMTALMSLAFYGIMSLLVHTGVLSQRADPISYAGGLTGTYVAVDFLIRGLLIGGLTYYLTAVLRVLREKEVALEAKTHELIQASQHKKEFTTNITHELRTPIHGIMGITEVFETGVYGDVSDKQREALASIRNSADGLLRLVDDLLELARAEAGKLEPRHSRFFVEDLLQRTVSSARWMQGRKHIDVELDVAEGMPEIESDPEMVSHVVANLLSNAIKFTPEGGRIFVRARMLDAERMELSVRDTGIGIPAAELPHVFEEFRQVDGTSSRRYGGAGVGLTLVRTLTNALGGEVRVASQLHKGSTFTVELPVAPR